MENNNQEFFGFGNDLNEQATNFNYDSISGLGESNYENEDLFSTEVESNNTVGNNNIFDNYYNAEVNNNQSVNDFGFNYVESNDLVSPVNTAEQNPFIQNFGVQQNNDQQIFMPFDSFMPNSNEVNNDTVEDMVNEQPNINVFEQSVVDTPMVQEVEETIQAEPTIEEPVVEQFTPVFEQPVVETPVVEEPVSVESTVQQPVVEQYVPPFETPVVNNIEDPAQAPKVEEPVSVEPTLQEPTIEQYVPMFEEPIVEENKEPITVSDTPIEELNKLTEFEEEKIEETDINALFDKVSVNVKDASDIFRRNSDLKQKIDTRFEQLKKLQSELENSRQKQLDEINRYKEEVLDKLTEKKEEIERRLNILKESQATLEKEKKEFEEYKKKEQDNIDKVQKEVQSAYDDRREELNHIEDVLRKQKDALDEERSQLSLDRIQYESDKNELANNLLKFNELVNSFTDGVNGTKE